MYFINSHSFLLQICGFLCLWIPFPNSWLRSNAFPFPELMYCIMYQSVMSKIDKNMEHFHEHCGFSECIFELFILPFPLLFLKNLFFLRISRNGSVHMENSAFQPLYCFVGYKQVSLLYVCYSVMKQKLCSELGNDHV